MFFDEIKKTIFLEKKTNLSTSMNWLKAQLRSHPFVREPLFHLLTGYALKTNHEIN
jgi:hypothetical protein